MNVCIICIQTAGNTNCRWYNLAPNGHFTLAANSTAHALQPANATQPPLDFWPPPPPLSLVLDENYKALHKLVL